VTITALDQNNAAVSGVVVTGSWSGATSGTGSCTTGTNGACSVTTPNLSSGASVTFSVSNLAKDGYTYDATANAVSSIAVTK
jgi:hypothetical protein